MSIFYNNLKKTEMLEEIRLNKGIDKLKAIYSDLVDNNPEMATKLINDKNVQFSTLFILQSEINRTNRLTRLSERNKEALELTNGILLKEISNTQRFSSRYKQEDYPVLKWILESGYKDDGLNDQYDEVLDTAAILLARVYKDKNALPIIEELIFNRYRKGAFIYDLVWAFFEVANTNDLTTVVNRLRSLDPKEVELARKLLNFIPCIGTNSNDDPMNQYKCSMQWIKLNKDFLYYTGETCLQTSNPHRYAVSLEAKYLQKAASSVNEDISRSLTEKESIYLDSFNKVDDDSRLSLSDYSSLLYHRSKYRWSKWLQNPIDKQIDIAKRILGGSL